MSPTENKITPEELAQVEELYSFHPTTEVKTHKYETIRQEAKELHLLILQLCPNSRQRATALTHLETAVMLANKAISLNP